MKLFMATLLTETNTFSPIPTGRRAYFEESKFYRNDSSRHPPDGGNIPMIVWRRRAERDGHEVVESICAFAQPGAPTTQAAYEELRGMLLEGGGVFLAGADEDSFDEHADESRVAVLAIAVEEPGEGFGVVDEGFYRSVLEEKGFAVGAGKGGVENDKVNVGGGRALAAHEGAGDEGGVGVRVAGCEDSGGEGENVAGGGEGHGVMLPRRRTVESHV